MNLTPAMQDFVLHWGEMGTRWGVNRSVAQVHALLHLSSDPLPADEISETLGLARSNVSTAIKELQGWGLIRVSRQLKDRRDHFTAERDMFEVVRLVVEGRRNREFVPTISAVEHSTALAESDGKTPAEVTQRMQETLEVMQMFDTWYSQMARLPRGTQLTMLKLGARIARYLPKSG
ncbi:MAG: GbsR/MarR family transcriptional regulator [Paracoccaceae bacterium]